MKSKRLFYDLYYNKLKWDVFRDRQIAPIYYDTDGIILRIELKRNETNINHLLKGRLDIFDFSNYKPGHPLYDTTNHGIALKFRDEYPDYLIKSVIALCPKTYCIQCMDEKGELVDSKAAAKGISKYKHKTLIYDKYLKVLEEGGIEKVRMYQIKNRNQQLYIMEVNKTALSALMVKSYLLPPNGVYSWPFGYWRIANEKYN